MEQINIEQNKEEIINWEPLRNTKIKIYYMNQSQSIKTRQKCAVLEPQLTD